MASMVTRWLALALTIPLLSTTAAAVLTLPADPGLPSDAPEETGAPGAGARGAGPWAAMRHALDASPFRSDPPADPLLRGDPAVWLPVFAESGSLSEAAEAASAERASQALHALGDADGDGRADLLLETIPLVEEEGMRFIVHSEEGEMSRSEGVILIPGASVLSLRSGATGAALWEASVPEDGYWYVVGDVDGDVVDDLVFVSEMGSADSSSTSAPVGAYHATSGEVHLVFDVRSGATGASLFAASHTMPFEYRSLWLYPTAAFAVAYTYEFGWAWVSPVGGSSFGADLNAVTYKSTDAIASAPVAFAYLDRAEVTNSVTRYDAGGAALWTAQPSFEDAPATTLPPEDYNGDGVPDVPYHTGGYPGSLRFAACPVLTCVGSGNVPQRSGVGLLDGATGEVAWSVRGEFLIGETFVTRAGSADGRTRDLFLHELTESPAVTTKLTRLSGVDGRAVFTDTDVLVFALAFGDVERDGKDEALVVRLPEMPCGDCDESPYRDLVTTIAASTMQPLWSATYAEAGLPLPLDEGPSEFVVDFDGDGALDIPFARLGDDSYFGELTAVDFRSGPTGDLLWTFPVDSERLVGVGVLDDVNGDGGADLVLVTSEVPQDVLDSLEGEPGEEREPFNYADYPLRVETVDGGDGQRIWRRAVHDPVARPNLTAEWLWVEATDAGDVNGNGAPDLLLTTLQAPWAFIEEGEAVPNWLEFSVALDGANGAVLASFPADFLVNPTEGAPDAGVELGPAAAASGEPQPSAKPRRGILPGFEGVVGALAFAGLAAWSRRRRGA